MRTYYKQFSRILVALDCIIFGFDKQDIKVLLVKRKLKPEKDKWSLVGGFMDNNESLDDAATRILYNLTGLHDIYMEQLYTFSKVNREPYERVISTVYYALIKTDRYDKDLVRESGARWFPIASLPKLIFDHDEMINMALKRLRKESLNNPIGFELLPEKFTMPELQTLYEAIHQKKFDRRNFSKKILSMEVLLKLNEKQKGVSRKGAYLYKFDKKRYKKLASNGFTFGL